MFNVYNRYTDTAGNLHFTDCYETHGREHIIRADGGAGMIQQNETINVGSSTTWATNEWTLCTNRLPCGICRLMQTACPLAVKPYDVTWKNPYEVTCKTEAQE